MKFTSKITYQAIFKEFNKYCANYQQMESNFKMKEF